MAEVLYRDRSFEVTTLAVKTKRRSIRLDKIEQTRMSRPLLGAVLGLWVLCVGFTSAFKHLLYSHEMVVLLAGPLIFLPLALIIGVLKLEYHALGGNAALIGIYRRLARVRAAVDQALEGDD